MLALSIRQPWAWLIVNGHKPIENRTWPTRVRGRVLVHAGKGCSDEEWDTADCFSAAAGGPNLPPLHELPRGGIVGSVVIADCVSQHDSAWFVGPWGFVLRDAKPLPFQPMRGALGFFQTPGGTP